MGNFSDAKSNNNFDDLMTQTAMTYPETYARDIKGSEIKLILEDVADNLFNEDPFYNKVEIWLEQVEYLIK